jgi:galactokinase
VVALIDSGKQNEIEHAIAAGYFAATGIRATSFVSRPADGAAVIEV